MPRLTHFLIAAAATAVLVASVAGWYASRERLPATVRLAAGKPGGLYHTFAVGFGAQLEKRTGRGVVVLATAGTEANLELLREGGADLAIVQTDCLTPAGVAGIAPLFPEPLHFLVRKGQPQGKEIRSVADLTGRRVALGSTGSGMRENARTLLAHFGAAPGVMRDVADPFEALAAGGDLDAAFVTTGWMNPLLMSRLSRNDLELVGIPENEGLALRHPWFTATTIPRGLYPGPSPAPPQPVPTVAVMAVLVGGASTPHTLVRESLAALYETDLRASFPAALSAKAARDYDAATMHPAVADYHNPSAGLNHLAFVLDFLSKSKEMIVALLALGVLLWDLARRRRERAAAAADHAQKAQLERFIQQTLAVELEQMEVSDPEELRPFLRQVTHVKQAALRELTSERVRGDQLFAIFLAQCAALSEKIQMRMVYGRIAGAPPEPAPEAAPAP